LHNVAKGPFIITLCFLLAEAKSPQTKQKQKAFVLR